MTQTPFLLLCDAITSSTGLARVGRDIAIRMHRDLSDIFRIGVLGVGGPIATSCRFPFPNYSIIRLQQMVPLDLPTVIEDFFGRYGDNLQEDSEQDLQDRRGQIRKGIVLTIWNLSWCQWLSQPWTLPMDHPIRQLLLRRPESVSVDHWNQISNPSSPSFSPALLSRLADSPFQRWLYCPVDGHLPDGTLGHQLAPILQGFDKILCYTRYGSEVVERTLEKWAGQSAVTTINSIPNLPHGLDTSIFYPRPRAEARQTFFPRVSQGVSQLPLNLDQILACVVATNSSRKDHGLAFATCAELLRRGMNIFLWIHTDMIAPHPSAPAVHWNLQALAKQYGMERRICITTARLSDDDMAHAYSAADIMFGIGAGEGWGLPMSESLGCGLPVIHGNYAGATEFIPREFLIDPVSFHLESPFMIQRSTHNPEAWALRVQQVLNTTYSVHERSEQSRSLLDPKYEWGNLWPRWSEWLKKGVE